MKSRALTTLGYEKQEGQGIITLNRPREKNTINDPLIAEFQQVLDEVEMDPEVRVVLITGGKSLFCAGADLKEVRTPGRTERSNQLFNRIERLGKPTIAAINGYALGGGLEMALCCDFRVASEDARLGAPEVKVGIIPSGGATLRLRYFLPLARVKEMLMIGEPLTGQEAFNLGLVQRLTPAGQAMDGARELAGVLEARAPLSLKAIKDCIHQGMTGDPGEAIAYCIQTADQLRSSEDYREGRLAFREKGKPVWKGR